MTANKRIFLNVVATYGRSLYTLVIGLFCGRWTLMALGEVDYGLVGVVGGLVGFVSFFNGLLSQAVSRFYAFSVGAESSAVNQEEGVEECRRWFTTAVVVHSVIPCFLILIGYPVGVWAVRYFLTIPPDRIADCVWVWRFVCASCFFGMVSVPFTAMYTAKQEIAELTIYSFVTTTANAIFLYFMVTHPGVWLVRYSLWTVCLGLVPQVIILIRAVFKYQECRFSSSLFSSACNVAEHGHISFGDRIQQIAYFAGCRMFGGLSIMASNEGQAILVNKYLGPASNAAMTIGNTVCNHAVTLATSLDGAMYPAITNAAGAGDFDRMRSLSYRACTFGALFVMLFAIPLAIEIDEVMILWLKDPPVGAGVLCVCMLVYTIFEKMTDGYWMSIFAIGRIGAYQFSVAWTGLLSVPIAAYFLFKGWGIVGVGVSLVFAKIITVVIRLYYGKKIAGLSHSHWIRHILLPSMAIVVITILVGSLPRLLLSPTFFRVVVTGTICELIMIPSVWFGLLSHDDRDVILLKIRRIAEKLALYSRTGGIHET